MNKYVKNVLDDVKAKNAGQPEFLQAVEEVLVSLEPVIKANPKYEANAILERMVEPERIVVFRVPWADDAGKIHVNRGFRIQFNGAIGPYKGGLRFDPTVNLSVLKFREGNEHRPQIRAVGDVQRRGAPAKRVKVCRA
ncbi:MAG: hypothetical protein IKH04_04450, partial [Kiritimatiellae bacterium]|nr:hypothetical protein [Kiritimatiellia bacterium]